jgi:Hsp90 protein
LLNHLSHSTIYLTECFVLAFLIFQEGLALGESEEEKKALEEAKAKGESLCKLMKEVLDDKVRHLCIMTLSMRTPCTSAGVYATLWELFIELCTAKGESLCKLVKGVLDDSVS